jgi:chemotaxis protein CheX
MKMELIQPFLNSLDAVIAETMGCSAEIADVTMEDGNYQRTGIAALVGISGEIEGRVILDMGTAAAVYLNISVRYKQRRSNERVATGVLCP